MPPFEKQKGVKINDLKFQFKNVEKDQSKAKGNKRKDNNKDEKQNIGPEYQKQS